MCHLRDPSHEALRRDPSHEALRHDPSHEALRHDPSHEALRLATPVNYYIVSNTVYTSECITPSSSCTCKHICLHDQIAIGNMREYCLFYVPGYTINSAT